MVDIRPNGNLILEGHRSIKNNEEVWDYSLTGEIRSDDVKPNNTVLSENVAALCINKREQGGHVRDSYRRAGAGVAGQVAAVLVARGEEQWVAPIAPLSGCRRHKKNSGNSRNLLRLRRPDRQAIGATREIHRKTEFVRRERCHPEKSPLAA